jgi:ABC-type nitrate/sulfonate/bicarbonate transport system permease component
MSPDEPEDKPAATPPASTGTPDDKKTPPRDAKTPPPDEKADDAKASADDKPSADAKAEAKAKKRADSEAEKAKKRADSQAEKEAEAEAKATKDAEKKAEKEREAKEDAEREAREAKDRKEREAKEAEEELKHPPKAPPWYQTLRADPPAYTRLALGVGLIAIVFGLWWFMTRGYDVQMQFNGRTKVLDFKIIASVDRIISAAKMPSPGEVFGSFGALLDRELLENAIATLWRVVKGVGMAAFVGIVLGVLSAAHRGVNSALAPLVIFLRSVPMGALIPLTLMLFGTEEPQKSKFIFLAIVPFVFSDTVKAVSIVPDRYIETAQTLGASRWQIVRKVLVPLALPDIITSLRFQLGLALGYIMLAEEINTQYGLGHMIFSSQREGPYEHVYLLLFVIALIAFLIDYFLRTIQRGVFAWRKDL